MNTKNVVRRHPERGSQDREAAYSVLDEALVCHVGFDDEGPTVIPMLHARVGDDLILHGSPASRLLKTLGGGAQVCITTTIIDGLVLADSAFDSSVNYRSVMVFGRAVAVDDLSERRASLEAFTDKALPGRRPHLRAMTDAEVRSTAVARIPIEEFSVKSRFGPSGSPATTGVWTGVIPTRLIALDPIPDGDTPIPDHVRHLLS